MRKLDKYSERFHELIGMVGGNKKAASIIGKSEKSIERYKRDGASNVSFEDLVKLTDAAHLQLDWLLGETDAPINEPHQIDGLTQGDIVTVPVINVSASAGGGSLVVKDEEFGTLAFARHWVEKNGLSPKQLFTMPSAGESMEPTIRAGEYLLCSSAEHHIKPGDGVYVVRLDGHILVKRLQVLPNNRLLITSDNTLYKPYEIELNDGVDFAILGKVVFVHGIRHI